MKKKVILIFLIGLWTGLFADLNSININKATGGRYIDEIAYLVDIEKIADHWSPEWNYKIKKETVADDLKKIYEKIDEIPGKNNKEKELLLGEVGFYLYNLDVAEYGKKSEKNFEKAIDIDGDDYRGYWFYAKYLVLSLNTEEGINKLHEAAKKKGYKEYPPQFWDDYASLSYMAGMMSNVLMGMAYEKELLGRAGYFEQSLGDVVLKNLKTYDKNKKIKAKEMWEYRNGWWVSWQFGLKMEIDESYKIAPGNYEDNNAVFAIKPPKEKINSKESAEYNITVVGIVPKEGDTLDGIVKTAFAKYKNIVKNEERSVTGSAVYEIIEKTKKGENRFIVNAIEREEPRFAGAVLEVPEGMEKSGTFTYNGRAVRFSGKIDYLIILYAGEKIFDKAEKVYNDFIENKLIIE